MGKNFVLLFEELRSPLGLEWVRLGEGRANEAGLPFSSLTSSKLFYTDNIEIFSKLKYDDLTLLWRLCAPYKLNSLAWCSRTFIIGFILLYSSSLLFFFFQACPYFCLARPLPYSCWAGNRLFTCPVLASVSPPLCFSLSARSVNFWFFDCIIVHLLTDLSQETVSFSSQRFVF